MKMMLKDGKRKVLTLSYDDGVVQDKRLVEILDKNGLKCTFNINTNQYTKGCEDTQRGRMTKSSVIKLLKNSGHEVAIHGYNHPFLEKLDTSEIIYEIMEDRKSIEKDFGVIARGMAYPFGTYNDTVVDVLKKCKVAYSRTTKATMRFDFPENWLMLHPTCHHNCDRLMELAKNFVENNSRWGNSQMFYLWGHSYEFDDNDNWNVIEEFAKYVGNRDNIWYATNIEVYDYVKAYENLQTSYDKHIITNPSAIDVWVETNGKECCVKAGETLTI